MSTATLTAARLLPADPAAEDLTAHLRHLGPLPQLTSDDIIDELERAGLTGHGGALFPTAVKWRAVASRASGHSVVVADAAETEPASSKDRTLLALRPHLVLDGIQLAAAAVGADRAHLYVSRSQDALIRTLQPALEMRRRAFPGEVPVEVSPAPTRYVAGEETAAVNRLNGRPGKPHAVPPRPFQQGVGGRPTLVQNVETLAHAALIARHGAAWFRSAGTAVAPGTALLTVSGAVHHPGVIEVPYDVTLGAIVGAAGARADAVSAILVGGYFGRWLPAARAWDVTIEPPALAALGASLGAGVVAVLPKDVCGVAESARVLAFLARESAGQCGPCLYGLAAVAETFNRVALGAGAPGDLERLARWVLEIRGRGACRHPDGATLFAASALEVFADELRRHFRNGPCRNSSKPPLLPTPVLPGGWR